MNLTVRVLGLELFALEITTDGAPSEGAELAGGTTTAYPLGFTASPGDQRWESGAGGGEL